MSTAALAAASACSASSTEPTSAQPTADALDGASQEEASALGKQPPSASDAGHLDSASDAALPDASDAGTTAVTATALTLPDFICDVTVAAGATYVATQKEIRLVQASGTSSQLLGTLSGPSGCPSIAVSGSTIFIARKPYGSATGEVFSLPVAGGTPSLLGTMSADTPYAAENRYPITADASYAYVAASPNVWRVPVAGGPPESWLIGGHTFYTKDLILGASALYGRSDASSATVSRISLTGSGYDSSSSTSMHGQRALAFGGGALFVTDGSSNGVIQKFAESLSGGGQTIASFGAFTLAADTTHLYAAKVDPLAPGGTIYRSTSIAVFDIASSALVRTIRAKAGAQDLNFSRGVPFAVDGAFLYTSAGSTLYTIPK
jgi:hypothetical protein